MMTVFKKKGKSIYHEVHGSGEPLLLIAGLGADSSIWSGVVKEFSKRFKTIVFDNRGSGRSGLFGRPHTVRRLADDAVGLLDHLKIERAHVIGHSMGGYIAQELAINYPGRVNKLILESTAPVTSSRNKVLFFELYRKLRQKGPFEAWIKTWTYWLFSPKTFDNGSFVETFIKLAEKYPYHSSAGGFKTQVEAAVKFDSRKRLSAIKAKTLIIEGEDDILIRPDEARLLAKHIRGSNLRLIKNTAHYVHLENPSIFTKIVSESLC